MLQASGYTQSKADNSLFTKSTTLSFTAILVYVDDLILGGNDMAKINFIKKLLDDQFSIKDLKYFLGLEVARSHKGLSLYQGKYALYLLQDTGLLAAKPSTTPMDPTAKLHKNSGEPYHDIAAYRRLLGRLTYLTHKRPDICYSVNHLSQFLDSSTTTHYNADLRIRSLYQECSWTRSLLPCQH